MGVWWWGEGCGRTRIETEGERGRGSVNTQETEIKQTRLRHAQANGKDTTYTTEGVWCYLGCREGGGGGGGELHRIFLPVPLPA